MYELLSLPQIQLLQHNYLQGMVGQDLFEFHWKSSKWNQWCFLLAAKWFLVVDSQSCQKYFWLYTIILIEQNLKTKALKLSHLVDSYVVSVLQEIYNSNDIDGNGRYSTAVDPQDPNTSVLVMEVSCNADGSLEYRLQLCLRKTPMILKSFSTKHGYEQ